MMKINSNVDLLAAYIEGKQILYITFEGKKIWPLIIQSCFHNGFWNDEYPWTDDYPWKDNNS